MIHLSALWKKGGKFLPYIAVILLVVTIGTSGFYYTNNQFLTNTIQKLQLDSSSTKQMLASVSAELEVLKKEDQKVRNDTLQQEIKNIQSTYNSAVTAYEKLLDLKVVSKDTKKLDELYAKSLKTLSEKDYASSSALLAQLTKQIDDEKSKVASTFSIPANVPVNNAPPSAGFRRQQVAVDGANYLVDIVSADLGLTRVIVDTASDGDCSSNCPVLSLGDYVSRNGAFAGINGSYFCPASYPSCAGKENSYDTLLMNKNKKYFNSDNNVYSTVPAAIFLGGSVRFVSKSLEWGRDTGVDGVIANQPLLVLNNQVVFGGDGEAKRAGKGSRSFVGSTGNTVYIGVVHNVNAAEMAKVLHTMEIHNALNLDSGGSTALWSGGYKAGPGRAIPNAILFVRK